MERWSSGGFPVRHAITVALLLRTVQGMPSTSTSIWDGSTSNPMPLMTSVVPPSVLPSCWLTEWTSVDMQELGCTNTLHLLHTHSPTHPNPHPHTHTPTHSHHPPTHTPWTQLTDMHQCFYVHCLRRTILTESLRQIAPLFLYEWQSSHLDTYIPGNTSSMAKLSFGPWIKGWLWFQLVPRVTGKLTVTL